MQAVKCRLINPRLSRRRTKLEKPGWAGKPKPRHDGSYEQIWHCVPLTEHALYDTSYFIPSTTNCASPGARVA